MQRFGKNCGLSAFLLIFVSAILAPSHSRAVDSEIAWHSFPNHEKFTVLGLPWFDENSPKLWRMPAGKMNSLPKGVQSRSKCSSGGRIAFRSATSILAIKVDGDSQVEVDDVEVFVNGQSMRARKIAKSSDVDEWKVLHGLDQQEKEFVIYLPHIHEIRITAIGVDNGTTIRQSQPSFDHKLPIVFYGSSVCQGSGAEHAGQTYTAIVSRELNLDFVNLGFGGAGKAESEVVEIVNSLPACCYVFDLGKSYGTQDATAFESMLKSVRQNHPQTPIVVVTPITSSKEVVDSSYAERSIHTRKVMREPAQQLINQGDRRLFLVEGEDLLGFSEHATLSKDGVHPSDEGYAVIAAKLVKVLEQAMQQ